MGDSDLWYKGPAVHLSAYGSVIVETASATYTITPMVNAIYCDVEPTWSYRGDEWAFVIVTGENPKPAFEKRTVEWGVVEWMAWLEMAVEYGLRNR